MTFELIISYLGANLNKFESYNVRHKSLYAQFLIHFKMD